jgi:pilus assembly protein Flp/PilA
MKIAMKMLINFLHDESGATAIEYGLIVAIMSVGVAGGISSYGANLLKLYNDIATAVLDAPTP